MYKHPPALHLAARLPAPLIRRCLPDDEPGHMWRPPGVVQRRVTALAGGGAVLVTTSNLVLQVLYPVPEPGVV